MTVTKNYSAQLFWEITELFLDLVDGVGKLESTD